MTQTLTATIVAAAIAASPVLMAPAFSQETIAPAAVSDTELDAFAGAFKDVNLIEQKYTTRIQQVGDEAGRQVMIKKAQAEMTQAVVDAPEIEVERFVQILQLVRADPALQARLTAKLQD